MRNWFFPATLAIVSLLAPLFAQAQLPVTTTLSAETSNNTSAAASFSGQSNGNLGGANVSKLPIRSLLYPGSTTKIFAHVEPWWGSGSHVSIGYSSQDAAQVHRQVQDMVSRGIDGVVIDWYGPGSYEDTGVKLMIAEAETTPNFTVLIEIDKGAIAWHSCYPSCSATTAAVNLFTQANTAFFSSPAMAKMNGKVMAMEFGMETFSLPSGMPTGWNKIDWNAVQAAVPNLAMFHRNLGGYALGAAAGAFSWMEPKGPSNFVAGFDDISDLTWFYSNSVSSYPSMAAFGATWKGFDDSIASWSANRKIDQNCGQTWLRTFNTINQYYSASNQLSALQLVTWNDYEEGTEVESGIDNCLNLTATLSGSTLQWNAGGDESTLDHYTVYASTDGQNLSSLGDFSTSAHSLDLSKVTLPAGSYQFFVQAVGKPTIRNRMSAAVSYTVTASVTPPPASGGGTTSGKDISITAAPPTQTVTRGSAGQYTLTLKQTGASDPVQLSCSGLPAEMSCNFSATTVTPDSNGKQVQLTITTSQTAELEHVAPVFALAIGGFGLLGLATGSKRRKIVLLALLLGATVLMQVACGGGTTSTSASTTPTTVTASGTTYAITVTATSGTVVRSTPITLTVN